MAENSDNRILQEDPHRRQVLEGAAVHPYEPEQRGYHDAGVGRDGQAAGRHGGDNKRGGVEMNAEEFCRAVQEYYKPWSSKIMGRMVVEWLSRHAEIELNEFFYMLVAEYPASYDKAVDVAALENAYKKNRQALEIASGNYTDSAGNIYRNGIEIGYYDSGRFIPNLAPLQALPDGIAGFVEYFGGDNIKPERYAEYLQDKIKLPAKRG